MISPTSPSERAVSPVIGVVLMVAIVVILAAAIGTFVLGMTPDSNTAPTATIELHEHDDHENITIVHEVGDPLDLDEHVLLVSGDRQDATDDLTGTLDPGTEHRVGNLSTHGEHAVVLRHEPSGTVIVESQLSIEDDDD